MDIALVSTRCPLSMAEGMQSAYVAALSAALAQHGENVTVYARQEQPSSARSVTTVDDYRVVSVPAGPAEPLTEDELLPHISQSAQFLDATWQRRRPEVVHAVS